MRRTMEPLNRGGSRATGKTCLGSVRLVYLPYIWFILMVNVGKYINYIIHGSYVGKGLITIILIIGLFKALFPGLAFGWGWHSLRFP